MESTVDSHQLSQRFIDKLQEINCPMLEKYGNPVYFDWLCDSKLQAVLIWFTTFVASSNGLALEDQEAFQLLSSEYQNDMLFEDEIKKANISISEANWKILHSFLAEVQPYLIVADHSLESYCTVVDNSLSVIWQSVFDSDSQCSTAIGLINSHAIAKKLLSRIDHNRVGARKYGEVIKKINTQFVNRVECQQNDHGEQSNSVKGAASSIIPVVRQMCAEICALKHIMKKYIELRCSYSSLQCSNTTSALGNTVDSATTNETHSVFEVESLKVVRDSLKIKKTECEALLQKRENCFQQIVRHAVLGQQLQEMNLRYSEQMKNIKHSLLVYKQRNRYLTQLLANIKNSVRLKEIILTLDKAIRGEIERKNIFLHTFDANVTREITAARTVTSSSCSEAECCVDKLAVPCYLELFDSSVRKISIKSDIWDKYRTSAGLIDRQYSSVTQCNYYEMLLSMSDFIHSYLDTTKDRREGQTSGDGGKYSQMFSNALRNISQLST